MQRKIFSINRISKVRGDFNKLLALISLALGTACMQIMLSQIVAHASDSRISPESAATSDAFFGGIGTVFTYFLYSIPFVLIFLGIMNTVNDSATKRKTEQEMAYYASLSPEEKQEFNDKKMRKIERLGREADQMAEQCRQRDQYKEHQEFLRKMEEERVARENKIRDFKNRYGREPNSWDL
jgi:hypothetical protein